MIINSNEYGVLIENMKKGDRFSFDIIFRKFYSPLVNYCNRFIDDNDVAEEIVQDFFVKIWLKHSTLLITTSLEAYLYKGVLNHTLNYIKLQKIREKHLNFIGFNSEPDNNNPLEKLKEEDLKLRMEEALIELPERSRKTFEMKRYEGLKYHEIAEKLNISSKTVEKDFSKALAHLRNALKDFIGMFFL